MFNLAKDALELFESSEVLEKRAILSYILQNYTVNEKTPCITIRSPFKELLSLTTQPVGLALTNDFREIDWFGEYPYAGITLGEIRALLV